MALNSHRLDSNFKGDVYMTKEQLLTKCERLESDNENLIVEIQTMHTLLISIGFPQGLRSLKDVANDVLEGGTELA